MLRQVPKWLLSGALLLSACMPEGRGEALLVPLDGKWLVMRGDSMWYCFPDYRDDHWPTITLPSRRLFKDLSCIDGGFPPEERGAQKGYIWFRRTFEITRKPRERLLFQAGEIMNADEVYVNGILVGATGRFPPQFRSGWASFRSYAIPPEIFRLGKNVIALRVYCDAEAWIMGPLRAIDYRSGIGIKMTYDLLKIYGMQVLTVVLAGLAVFFLFLFLRRRKELLYFYFSLCALAQAITIGLCFFENLYPDLPYSSDNVLRVTQSALLLVPPFMVLFYRSYCGDQIGLRKAFLYASVPLSGIILMMIMPERADILRVRNIYLLSVFIYIFDLLYRSVREFRKKNKSGILMFIGLTPTVVLGVLDILAFSFGVVETSMALYLYGVPAMIIFFAGHLVDRFVTSLEKMEQLNIALQESIVENMRLAALERELDIARTIQLSTLPAQVPVSQHFDIAVKYVPAEKIGGDYYHFYASNGGGLGVLIADVSGHGVPAALISSMIKITADMLSHLAGRPDQFVTEMNRRLIGVIGQQFLTGGYVFLDCLGRRLLYARAGHLPLIIQRRRGGNIEELMPRGRAIGFDVNSTYDLCEGEIRSGDRLVLFTDCLIEAKNRHNEMFGEDRFKNILISEAALDAVSLAGIIYREVHQWSERFLEDDFTLIVVDVR